jgi:hypothetical protein
MSSNTLATPGVSAARHATTCSRAAPRGAGGAGRHQPLLLLLADRTGPQRAPLAPSSRRPGKGTTAGCGGDRSPAPIGPPEGPPSSHPHRAPRGGHSHADRSARSSGFVAGRYLDVLASNPRAQALSPNFCGGPQPAASVVPRSGPSVTCMPIGTLRPPEWWAVCGKSPAVSPVIRTCQPLLTTSACAANDSASCGQVTRGLPRPTPSWPRIMHWMPSISRRPRSMKPSRRCSVPCIREPAQSRSVRQRVNGADER